MSGRHGGYVAALGGLAALLFAGPLHAEHRKDEPAGAHSAREEKADAKSAPAVLEKLEKPKAAADGPRGDGDEQAREPPPEWAQELAIAAAVAQAVIAFAALIGLFFTVRYAKAAWIAAADAAKHTETAAKAANDSLAHAGETARRQLRAYVAVEIADGRGIFIPGEEPNARIAIKNVGATPAFMVAPDASYGTYPISGEGRRVLHATQTPTADQSLLPQANRTVVIPLALNEGAATEMREGRRYLAVNGTVTYKDAFGRSCWTNFSHVYDAKSPAGRYSDSGNDCDVDGELREGTPEWFDEMRRIKNGA